MTYHIPPFPLLFPELHNITRHHASPCVSVHHQQIYRGVPACWAHCSSGQVSRCPLLLHWAQLSHRGRLSPRTCDHVTHTQETPAGAQVRVAGWSRSGVLASTQQVSHDSRLVKCCRIVMDAEKRETDM